VDEHLLVVVGASRRNQVEPDGPGSRANQAIKDQALQISAAHAGQAPSRRPGGRAQITPLCAQPITGDDRLLAVVDRCSPRHIRRRRKITRSFM
jgi:hypothetical protein